MGRFVAALLVALQLAGCSVYMAASSEGKKDLDIVRPGASRDIVLAEFGTPVASATENGENFDLFRFTRERSTGSNAGRAVAYGAAAVLTLGLSEVVATPLEAGVGDAGVMSLKVFYNEAGQVTRAMTLDDEAWVPLAAYLGEEEAREENSVLRE